MLAGRLFPGRIPRLDHDRGSASTCRHGIGSRERGTTDHLCRGGGEDLPRRGNVRELQRPHRRQEHFPGRRRLLERQGPSTSGSSAAALSRIGTPSRGQTCQPGPGGRQRSQVRLRTHKGRTRGWQLRQVLLRRSGSRPQTRRLGSPKIGYATGFPGPNTDQMVVVGSGIYVSRSITANGQPPCPATVHPAALVPTARGAPMRSSHWWRVPALGISCVPASWPGWLSRTRTPLGDRVALPCEPGRCFF